MIEEVIEEVNNIITELYTKNYRIVDDRSVALLKRLSKITLEQAYPDEKERFVFRVSSFTFGISIPITSLRGKVSGKKRRMRSLLPFLCIGELPLMSVSFLDDRYVKKIFGIPIPSSAMKNTITFPTTSKDIDFTTEQQEYLEELEQREGVKVRTTLYGTVIGILDETKVFRKNGSHVIYLPPTATADEIIETARKEVPHIRRRKENEKVETDR